MNNIQLINASNYKAFFAIAGGGQTFVGEYCLHSGASKTVIGALIPYDRVIFDNFIGGVMITLAALCLAQNIDMNLEAEIELDRIWKKIDKIRAKQLAKPKHSPLPQ